MSFDFTFFMDLSAEEENSSEQSTEVVENDKMIVESGENYYNPIIDIGKTLNDKLDRNIKAIKIIKQLEEESRNASKEEQEWQDMRDGAACLSLSRIVRRENY